MKKIMEINNSDFMAFAALLISGVSAYYSKGQRDLAKTTLQTNYRGLLAQQHEKYRDALKMVEDAHRDEITRLSNLAATTIVKVIDIFDAFDIEEPRPRYLRHLIHECSEMAYNAFKGQLGWQSGANISGRMSYFIHCEDNLNPRSRYYSQDSDRSLFAHEYFNDCNSHQEWRLFSDIHFCALVKEMKRRLAPSDGPAILTKVLEEFQNFGRLLKETQQNVRGSAEHLDQLIKEGAREQFKLHESPNLFDHMTYTQSTLENLSCLHIPDIAIRNIHHYRNFVSITVYLCIVLHAAQNFHSWGWREYST